MTESATDRASRAVFVSFYPSDWKGGTALWPPMAEWTYLQICLHNWDTGEALPAIMLRMVLCRNPEWETDLEWLITLGKVIKTASSGYFVRRALAEYQRSKALIEKKANAGKKGAEKRWGNNALDGTAKENACQSNSNQNQNQNQKEPNGSYPPTPHDIAGDLIFAVPREIWRDFKEHRCKLKAPMTERAERGILRKLEELHGQGHDPTAVLEQSIVKGWRDVFAIKESSNGYGNGYANGSGQHDKRDGIAKAIDRRLSQLDEPAGQARQPDVAATATLRLVSPAKARPV